MENNSRISIFRAIAIFSSTVIEGKRLPVSIRAGAA
jgi:hypothetical protein